MHHRYIVDPGFNRLMQKQHCPLQPEGLKPDVRRPKMSGKKVKYNLLQQNVFLLVHTKQNVTT